MHWKLTMWLKRSPTEAAMLWVLLVVPIAAVTRGGNRKHGVLARLTNRSYSTDALEPKVGASAEEVMDDPLFSCWGKLLKTGNRSVQMMNFAATFQLGCFLLADTVADLSDKKMLSNRLSPRK